MNLYWSSNPSSRHALYCKFFSYDENRHTPTKFHIVTNVAPRQFVQLWARESLKALKLY